MKVIAHEPAETLLTKARHKTYAEIKDRLRAIAEALKGGSAERIAKRLFVGARSVKRWVKRYNEEGEKGLWDKPRPGQPQKLTHEQQQELFTHVERGPSLEEGRSRYRLIDLCVWVQERFGVSMKKGGMQNLLYRNGYGVLRARPTHEKSDPATREQWKKEAPLLSKRSKMRIQSKRFKSSSKTRHGMDKKGESARSGRSGEPRRSG